jgi:hypothetical protein
MYSVSNGPYTEWSTTFDSKSNLNYDAYSIKRLLRCSKTLRGTREMQLAETNATTATNAISGRYSGKRPISNTTDSVMAMHPVVRVSCWGAGELVYNTTGWSGSYPFTSALPDLRTLISRVSDTVQLDEAEWYSAGATAVSFSPLWISSLHPAAQKLLVAFFSGLTPETLNRSELVRPGLLVSMIEDDNPEVKVSLELCRTSYNH